MAKSKRKKNNHKSLKIVGTIVGIGILVAYFFLFSSMSSSGKTEYIFIDHNDNIDSVYHKLEKVSTKHSLWAFKQMAAVFSYKDNIKPGRYTIGSSGALLTFRNFKNG